MPPPWYCLRVEKLDKNMLCADCSTDIHELVFNKGQAASRKQKKYPIALTEVDAKKIIEDFYGTLEKQSKEERESYLTNHVDIPQTKAARWGRYTNKDILEKYNQASMQFLLNNSEFRTKQLFSPSQLRFLIAVQHLISEDADEMDCEPKDRKHLDIFEGKSECVNSQLIKDVHRSEWSIEGQGFSLQKILQQKGLENAHVDTKRETITQFQQQFVITLEAYLLAFAERRRLPQSLRNTFIKIVTTQMSQCGLANLDQAGTASKYFVSGQGLEQRTVYNLSTFNQDSVKLSILCMKTAFCTYHTEQTLEHGDMSPKSCKKGSYLYQYATIQITPVVEENKVRVTVIDALDEAHIVPDD